MSFRGQVNKVKEYSGDPLDIPVAAGLFWAGPIGLDKSLLKWQACDLNQRLTN